MWLPAVVWQIGRARKERRVLEDAFGDEYRRYKERVSMILPWRKSA